MVFWIVSMVMMKSNVQGTSVWVKINFIVSKIKLASKLLNDVMEHLIVLVSNKGLVILFLPKNDNRLSCKLW